jgi:hypothetical protein
MSPNTYQLDLQNTVRATLQALVSYPGPIDASHLLGVVRSIASQHRDSPLAADTLHDIQKNHSLFLSARPVDPDVEAAPGVTYRSLGYFTVVGSVKYGWAPGREYVRMDLTQAPI